MTYSIYLLPTLTTIAAAAAADAVVGLDKLLPLITFLLFRVQISNQKQLQPQTNTLTTAFERKFRLFVSVPLYLFTSWPMVFICQHLLGSQDH